MLLMKGTRQRDTTHSELHVQLLVLTGAERQIGHVLKSLQQAASSRICVISVLTTTCALSASITSQLCQLVTRSTVRVYYQDA